MNINFFRRLFVGIVLLLISGVVYAEVVTDGTLGPATNLSGPNFAVDAQLGQQKGNNLFHSFETFNINTGESATFTGSDSVANILTRVTGDSYSYIDGLIRSTIPNADMYFLNPNGILFGENAILDTGGSFHVSTADYLRLGENGRFDATLPENSLLTVAPPEAFGFLSNNPSAISIEDSFLRVPEGETISVIGGDIKIRDSYLIAPSGQINLVAVASAGKVPISFDLDEHSFDKLGTIKLQYFSREIYEDYDDTTPFGRANIDVSGNGGQIFIRSNELVLDNAQIMGRYL